ncbi:MAG: hypothetical protein ACR2JZ_06530 [Candidatus Limnocylindrales bacterium]
MPEQQPPARTPQGTPIYRPDGTPPTTRRPVVPRGSGDEGSRQSYSERYRGTQWGTPADAISGATVVPVGNDARTGRRSRPLLLVAGMVAAAIIAGLTFFVLQAPQGSAPAAAGPTTSPDASRSARLPSPSATSVTRTSVIKAFVATVTEDDFGYSLKFTAAYTATEYGGYEVARLNGDLDVLGDDFYGSWRTRTSSSTDAYSVTYQGQYGYARLPEEDWQCLGTDQPRPNVNPFRGLEGEKDVRYEDAQTRDGHRLHRLRITRQLDLRLFASGEDFFVEPDLRGAVFDIFVRDDGTPVRADYTARYRVAVETLGKTEVRLESDYRFREVGDEVKIPRPPDVCEDYEPPV